MPCLGVWYVGMREHICGKEDGHTGECECVGEVCGPATIPHPPGCVCFARAKEWVEEQAMTAPETDSYWDVSQHGRTCSCDECQMAGLMVGVQYRVITEEGQPVRVFRTVEGG